MASSIEMSVSSSGEMSTSKSGDTIITHDGDIPEVLPHAAMATTADDPAVKAKKLDAGGR